MKSLNSFKEEIQPIIRDRTDNVVTDADYIASANRIARHLKNDHGIYAAKNKADLFVYPDVYEYPLPSDFHDLRELQLVDGHKEFDEVTAVEFWRRLDEKDIIATDTILGQEFLLVNQTSGSKSQAHTMSSLTDNGTWAVVAASDAVSISRDTLIKIKGGASISFNVDVSNSGNDYAAIDNSTLTALDWTDFLNKGVLFIDVYIPDNTNVTGVTARWGDDSSNYYSNNATTQFNGLSLATGWNKVGIAWNGATTTGSPTVGSVNYLHLQLDYSASQTDMTAVRFDNVFMASPTLMHLQYYSTYFAVDGTTSANKEDFESISDKTLLLDADDDVVFWNMLADAQWILELFEERAESIRKADEALSRLKSRHASERKKATVRYYAI